MVLALETILLAVEVSVTEGVGVVRAVVVETLGVVVGDWLGVGVGVVFVGVDAVNFFLSTTVTVVSGCGAIKRW